MKSRVTTAGKKDPEGIFAEAQQRPCGGRISATTSIQILADISSVIFPFVGDFRGSIVRDFERSIFGIG
jgi:hypothetical protein